MKRKGNSKGRPSSRGREARATGRQTPRSTPEPARSADCGAKKKQPAPAEATAIASASAAADFPVVGIGASAGGLEALEQFLGHVPERSGMAYVVIQHLDPKHKDAMVELLQRRCAMPVLQARDDQRVEPDHVYVIPPNADLSILRGVLQLLPQSSVRGLHLPIDYFFRALAQDQQEWSVGVVLSGMGSDGTLGLRAIKERAGTAFVQAVSSAKFEGMPQSAIDAELADVVAPAEELPGRILAFRRHTPYLSKLDTSLEEKTKSAIEKVYLIVRAQTGNDFSLYKKSTIHRRIERRMGLHQIDKIDNYVRYLRENPRETELLFKELLIGVTSFFRDPAAWDALRDEALPRLFEAYAQGGVMRAWVPGCSTGEEAYSLAIVFKETLERLKPARGLQLQIYATDLDRDAIDKARQATYPLNIAADVSPERLRRFFVRDDHGYRVAKEIRAMVVFAPQNIIADPPFTKLDVLSCRNLLIYLSPELQRRLIPLFHYCLNPGAVLFLGSAETVGAFTSLFGPLNGEARLFRRLETSLGAAPVEFPSSFAFPSAEASAEQGGALHDARKVPPPNLQTLVDRLIVQRFSPAAVITTEEGDILYISGRTGKYLEPAVGKANLNILAMARDGLRYELSRAFASALRQEAAVALRGLVVGTNGGTQTIDVVVQKLSDPKELRGTVIVVLSEAPRPALHTGSPAKPRRAPAKLAEMEEELQRAREEVRTTREEMQTSQEELKSTNEELQSTNEELQSTNEELTTSKEEMRSMNEELQTVNHELQAKVDELSRSNDDMTNLLNSTDIATLFLDRELRVRRFTTPASKLIKLIPGDIGRPVTDMATELDYPSLADDAREVLRTLVSQMNDVGARSGQWFTVRIMPYRTLDNVIDGVVITFTDSTSAKVLERTLREQASQLRQMAESLPNLVMGCLPTGACDFLSQQWVEYTGVSEAQQVGYGWLERVNPRDRERVREEWTAALKRQAPLNTEFRIRGKEGVSRWFKTRSVPIRDERGVLVKWYGSCTDIEDLKQAAEARHAAEVPEASASKKSP